jgi:ribosomal protein L11 methyltransferase
LGKVWPALDIHIPACDPELLELVLADLDDFYPTAIQDPDGATPLRVFFTTPGDRDAAAQAIGRAFARGVFIAPIDIGDEDWATRSQAQLRAIAVGRIVVAPPWDTYKTGSDNTVVIQPSMGFGTGHHATTRLVLKALQDLPLEGRSVLDIGCGSGVLAIAAVKLGARAAVAVDIDPDALDNARENAALNDIGDRIRFELGDYRQMSLRAEIVMANLTGGLLEQSAEALAAAVAPGGWLIVSGLMEHERAAVVLALEKLLALKTIAQEAEWMCASFRRGEAL